MTEKDLENIICKYPELIEKGLSIEGRQVCIQGKHIDILFTDRHGQKLIIELKKGVIKREHIAQLLDYEGYYLTPDDPTIRVMLVGNRVPINFRKALDHHGLEWKELSFVYLHEFLKIKRDYVFLKLFEQDKSELSAHSNSNEHTEKSNEAHKPHPHAPSVKGAPRLNKATSFDDLC